MLQQPPASATAHNQPWRFTCLVGQAMLLGFLAIILSIFMLVLDGSQAAASPVDQPATPDLIDQAYHAGAITWEERLLYLAYSVYEPVSLPVVYRSKTPWWGTATVAELNRALERDDPTAAAISAAARAELTRLLRSAAATVCDQDDAPNSLESANFHLNYGAIGGGLTAQSYVDSLETTFGVEVSVYGWAEPPLCTANNAICPAVNPWGKYPVQAAALGGGLYGYVTTPGGDYTGLVGDNPNTAPIETEARASCMVLNNDFSGFPGGAQYSLDATTAHEFVHSIQFGYGDPGDHEDAMWYESSAAYMEDEVFDDINDNYQYLWPAFNRCLGDYKASQGTPSVYSNWLFFRFVAERNGGANTAGGGEEIMQHFWANVAAGQGGLRAYDNALQSVGANLADTFHEYAIASSLMSGCPTSSPYCFEEAAGYVAEAGPISPNGQIDAVGGLYQGNLPNHFAANWVALPTTGAYSPKLENLSSGGQLQATIVAVTNSGVMRTPLPDLVGGNQTASVPAYQPPADATGVFAVITNQEWTNDNPSSCAVAAYRLQLNPASALAVDVQAPTHQQVKPGESVNHQFQLTNGGLQGGVFTLQATSSLGWADITSVPSTITIASGETVLVTVTVTVPMTAAIGQVEETTLYAESVDDPTVNDAATVRTLPPGGKALLPIVTYNLPPPPDTFFAVDDTTVLQGYPNDTTCNTVDMWAGYDDMLAPDGKIVRSLVRFDLSAIPAGTAISSAALHLYHLDSWDFPNRIRTITTYRIASNWSACSTTWSNQPSIGDAYGSSDLPSASGQWYSFDVTELARGWINGAFPNYGIEVRGPEASGEDSAWRSFATLNSTNDPYLTIDYAAATESHTPIPAYAQRERDVEWSGGNRSVLAVIADLSEVDAVGRESCAERIGVLQKCRTSH